MLNIGLFYFLSYFLFSFGPAYVTMDIANLLNPVPANYTPVNPPLANPGGPIIPLVESTEGDLRIKFLERAPKLQDPLLVDRLDRTGLGLPDVTNSPNWRRGALVNNTRGC